MNKVFLLVGLYLAFGQYACKSNSQLSDTGIKKVLYDSTDFYVVSIAYPLDSRDVKKEMEVYATGLFGKYKEDWKKGGDLYNSEQEITKEFPDRAGYHYNFLMDYDSLVSPKTGTVSYVFNYFEYTGGANGFSGVRSFVFSDADSSVYISDILDFTEGKDLALTELLAKTALKNPEVFTEDFVLNGLGIGDEKHVEANEEQKCKFDRSPYKSNFQNFVLSDVGITFYYDKYELAPGAAGVTHISLTWEELRPFLKMSQAYGVN